MRAGRILIIAGAIVSVFGLIFHLQGQSVLGPESSFMYSNPDWITWGIQIIVVGVIISGIGCIATIKKQ